jgi:deazaflavin-dependent oxidoreductase (nitroreductase family)
LPGIPPDTSSGVYPHLLRWRRILAHTTEPAPPMTTWSQFANEHFCYLTTTGRVTGHPRRIEMWFAIDEGTLYMLSGARERSDWVKNALRQPAVIVEIGTSRFEGRARSITDRTEDERARALVHDKYAPGHGADLTSWRHSSLPIAVDLDRHTNHR